MMIGFAMMLITGLLLYYAIPVRTTQSLWFRIKVVLLIVAGINAFFISRKDAGFEQQLGPRPHTTQAHTRGCNAVAGLMGWGCHHRPHDRVRLV